MYLIPLGAALAFKYKLYCPLHPSHISLLCCRIHVHAAWVGPLSALSRQKPFARQGLGPSSATAVACAPALQPLPLKRAKSFAYSLYRYNLNQRRAAVRHCRCRLQLPLRLLPLMPLRAPPWQASTCCDRVAVAVLPLRLQRGSGHPNLSRSTQLRRRNWRRRLLSPQHTATPYCCCCCPRLAAAPSPSRTYHSLPHSCRAQTENKNTQRRLRSACVSVHQYAYRCRLPPARTQPCIRRLIP